jgi:peptide/nickel transport system substrate-binding protein
LLQKKTLRSLFLLSLCSTLLLGGCNNNPDSDPNQNSVSNNINPEVLKLLYWQSPTILNPHLSNGFKDSEASRITLEPLASFDNNGKLVLFLAQEEPTLENGGLSADGKSVTWKLKQNIKWSDGKPFTADDVVFTYQYITNPQIGTTTAGSFDSIETIEAIDDYTVKITFKEPNPAWFLVFTGNEGMILPKHLLENYNGENAREAPTNLIPVGTGPYKVVEFKPGDMVIYEPNSYFREADQLAFKRIELKGGGDATSAARAVLQTGDGDFAYNLQVEGNILEELETKGKGKVVANLGAQSERLIFNFSDPNKEAPTGERSFQEFPHPFFSDENVRQAFAYAIDREAIATQLYGKTGQTTPNLLLAPPQYNSPNNSYEFNLEKANQLLNEAGWKDTNNNGIRDKDGIEMKILFQSSVNPLRQKTQEVIKQGLQQIGVEVELKSIDASIFFSGDPANNDTTGHFYADLQMYTTGNTNPDPGAYMKSFTCNDIPQKANNWTGDNTGRFCSKEYDELWQKAQKELDIEKRNQLYIEMNDLLVKNNVAIPLVHRADTIGVSNTLQGVELTPWDMRTWNIKDWKRTL